MDVFSWMAVGRNWGGACMVTAAAAVGGAPLAVADEGQSAGNSVVVIVDDNAVIATDDGAVQTPAATPIHWSSPAGAPAAGPPAPSNFIAQAEGAADAEPLRAVRPTFISDSAVTPAALYDGDAAWTGPQQPLRRSTTLQLRPQSSGRSLAERLASIGRGEPAPPPVQNPPARRLAARGPVRGNAQQESDSAAMEQSSGVDAAAARLVQAHQISLAAGSEGEYSQIITLCSEAVHDGVEAEQKQFAVELAAWALNRRGEIRTEEGQDQLAMADFRAALDYDPDHWRTLHNRGVTYAQQGQFAEAFDDVSRVIELNPDFAKAYANRATLYVQAGDMEKAMGDYSRAIELDDQLTAARVGRGRVLHMLGRWEAAVADFDAAIGAGEADATLYCSRGDLLADLGRYGEALADYAEAIELDPSFAHAYRNGAWLLATCPDAKFRDAKNALVGAEQALACGYGDRHAALDALAAALANAGRFDEAVATEQQAIDVAPAELREAYEYRLQLYEAQEPYRTSPVGQ